MSLLSTYSSASIRGWQGGGSIPYTNSEIINSSPPIDNTLFGFSSDISENGSYIIVGNPYEVSQTGAAYVFYNSGSGGWVQQAQLLASDAATGDQFGWSVSINSTGDVAVVGAPQEDTGGSDAGAAYIFTRTGSTWTEQTKIQASDKTAGDLFGYAVDINRIGNGILVGAPVAGVPGNAPGAAYFYVEGGGAWSQQQKIQAGDLADQDNFGCSVAIAGDADTIASMYAIVGADSKPVATADGAVYIFGGFPLSQQQKFSGANSSDFLGDGVSINDAGDIAVAGARNALVNSIRSGAAYVYTRSGSTWTQQQEITRQDNPTAGDGFGRGVSINDAGNIIIVGAIGVDVTSTNSGAAFTFQYGGTSWQQTRYLPAQAGLQNDTNMGRSVSISGNSSTVIAGAPNQSVGGGFSFNGVVYIFY